MLTNHNSCECFGGQKFKCATIFARSTVFTLEVLIIFREHFNDFCFSFLTLLCSSIIELVRKVRRRLSTLKCFFFDIFMFEEVQRTHSHTNFSPFLLSPHQATNSFRNLRKNFFLSLFLCFSFSSHAGFSFHVFR